ncbi:hypothetical protein [Pyruvatibacter sp.]
MISALTILYLYIGGAFMIHAVFDDGGMGRSRMYLPQLIAWPVMPLVFLSAYLHATYKEIKGT